MCACDHPKRATTQNMLSNNCNLNGKYCLVLVLAEDPPMKIFALIFELIFPICHVNAYISAQIIAYVSAHKYVAY